MIVQLINISHLHPLLVHLPIGFLILLFLLEVLFRTNKSKDVEHVLKIVLLLTLLSSIVSLFTGWKLGGEGGYEGDLLKLHKWTAVALTISVGVLYAIKMISKKSTKLIYWTLLSSVIVLLTITGHYGASMTHGENFLFEHKEPIHVSISDVSEAMVYSDIIRPIFENNCSSCHNTGKANGGLIMTSKEALLKGGKSGDFFSKTGKASALQRLHMPLEDKQHMPPNGKVQLTEEQVFYLEWWIENDHCFDCKVSDLNPTERELELLELLEEDDSSLARLERSVSPFSLNWINQLNRDSISAVALDEESHLVSVNLSQITQLTDEHFSQLNQYSENIVELNLSNTNLKDDFSSRLGVFKNLVKIQLANTSISDKTSKELAKLELLESINLYGTNVTSESLNILSALPNLKSVYVWQTEIDKNDLAKFLKESPTFSVIGQFESPLLAESKLESPVITSTKTLFEDTLNVQLKTDFEGADIFYTLDGTRPDTSSYVYNQQVVLSESAILSAVTYKDGWGISTPAQHTFKQVKIPLESADINGSLHENYSGNNQNSIYDGVLGSSDFKDGNWLGFQGNSPLFILELKKTTEISNISISAMSDQRSWIFYPKGFTVHVSKDKKSWEKVHYSSQSPLKQIDDNETKFFELPFMPVSAKYVKLEVQNILKLPEWHASPGEAAYVFLDEILVE